MGLYHIFFDRTARFVTVRPLVPTATRGAAPGLEEIQAGRGSFVGSKGKRKYHPIRSCSSGVERILGKDEVDGSIPSTSSKDYRTITLRKSQRN